MRFAKHLATSTLQQRKGQIMKNDTYRRAATGLTITLFAVVALSACSTTTEVTPIGRDTFMVGSSAYGGHLSHTEVKALSYRRAADFCGSKGKVMAESTSKSSGARGWTPLGSEVIFTCADETPTAKP
jgi:hypothetical protein